MRAQMPAYEWTDRPLETWLRADIPTDPSGYIHWRSEHAPTFFFEQLPSPEKIRTPQAVIDEADAILAGKWRYFSHTIYEVGFPPDWHLNPLTGRRLPTDRHWSQIGDFDDGDIKLVWEANRFSIVYTLARAYAVSHDERYPAAFWQLVEDWRARNPPMRGPNWKCGQEATFRVMAWCFGLYAFRESAHSTPERIATLTAMFAAHGARIAGNIRYAISQHNNHSVSEGVGLWTIGLLFPELKNAKRWRRRGKNIIEAELARQIAPNGDHVQRSTNYARLVLHDALWALRLGELNEDGFSAEAYAQVELLTNWLRPLIDAENGQVPNYGANDGALILPLDSYEYGDFRPVLQASHWLTLNQRLFPTNMCDELTMWLFEPHPPPPSPLRREGERPTHLSFGRGAGGEGIYLLHSDHSRALLYCADYRGRPGHADQLHVDLWWYGVNIACDAGTYLYNGDPPWQNGLSGTSVHNTVTVDGRDQMTRVGRFLWLDWAKGTVLPPLYEVERGSEGVRFAQHTGYKPIIHRRTLASVGPDEWLITDELTDQRPHNYRLHWLFADAPYTWDSEERRLTLHYPAGDYRVQIDVTPAALDADISLVRADPESIRGWRSRFYADREPALSLAVTVHAPQVKFISRFAPTPVNMPRSTPVDRSG
jgi:asparagine synthase (glutamine-hydrolysing)